MPINLKILGVKPAKKKIVGNNKTPIQWDLLTSK